MANSKSNDNLLESILRLAVTHGASDVHAATGEPVHYRIEGQLRPEYLASLEGNRFSSVHATQFIESILSAEQQSQLHTRGSVDGAYSLEAEHRFRFNVYRRESEFCFAFRLLANSIPTLDKLGLHDRLYNLCELTDGLVLVAGPTGSGKSTSIAAMIDRINQSRPSHIITIEDPIEFIHRSQKSLVNQRQIGTDVATFGQALQDAVRQDPDVILVGELRDLDAIRTAITAAETGHLVFASVHAGDCKTAIERLIGAFSAEEQNLAQRLVATVLRTVIVQHLLPRQTNPHRDESPDTTRVLASEVMHCNTAISNLIATGNLSQIASIIQTSGDEGMWTLDDSLAKLWRTRAISEKTARSLARNPEILAQISRRSRAR
ncbi:MAG: twitching motility protein PilT [Mariniblastus sp.]|jgi:twitching motility protein PilT